MTALSSLRTKTLNASPIPAWHKALENKDKKALLVNIHDQCIFYSPIIFKPQKGKALTKMYLGAAFEVFNEAGDFKYVLEVENDNHAVLEFNVTIDGIQIDGVDILTWNDDGKITEFKVMLRPFRSIEKVGEKMRAKLEGQSAFTKLKIGLSARVDKFKGNG